MAIKLNDKIIDDLNLTFEDAFRTDSAPISENTPTDENIIENVRFLTQVALLPLQKNLIPDFSRKYINSWYRSESVNNKVGGASTSNHLFGSAIDISVQAGVDSRQVNADIFYFLWGYLTENSIPFDELIWEVSDKNFAASVNSKIWPQWVHLSVNRNGANRKKVFSIGVEKDFNVNTRTNGFDNSGKSFSVLTYSNPQDIKTFESKFNQSVITNTPDFSVQAKGLQTAFTWFSTKERLQFDYVSTNGSELIRGTFMNLSTTNLIVFLRSIGAVSYAQKIEEINSKGSFSKEAESFRKDKPFLAKLATLLNSKKSVNAQFELFFDILNETLTFYFPLIKEPFCLSLVMDNTFYGQEVNSLAGKNEIQSISTDGSWLDYHIRANQKTQINPDLRRQYGISLNSYFEIR